MEGNIGGVFTINNMGQVSVPQNGLIFDDNSFYSLLIVAENVDDSCQRSRFKLNIHVGRNEIIFPALPPVPILETAGLGTEVTTIDATGGAGQIEYTILNSVPFTIGLTTGKIEVDGVLDFETEMQYNVMVQAESVGTIVSGTVTQVVNVQDVNEQPVWVTACALSGDCMAAVAENQPSSDIGSRLEIVDADLPSVPNGQITYTIVSDDTSTQLPFAVNSSGSVRTTAHLNREERDMYSFTVRASDGGNPPLSVTTTFLVQVEDLNDEAPIFIQAPELVTIPENEPVDTVIAQYITTDGDTPVNAEVSYSLSPTSGLPFQLNSSDGVLTIREKIDYENPSTRQFFITVTANNPPLSSTAMTQIDITDVNDNTPVFDQPRYDPSVPEHSDVGTPVVTVSATDADSGTNGDIRYAITGGNSQGYFTIGSVNGAITVAADIDRELVGSVDLTVRARDRGSPRLLSRATVTVTISDINDHPPIFNPDFYSVALREDTSVGTLAFTAFATDADKPDTDNSRIIYSIISGNTGSAFNVNSTSGAVKVSNALNHETIPSYTLTIQAEDQGDPQMSATARAEVTIINVNEAPPTLSGDQTVNVSESTPVGVNVATFSASDPDFTAVSISITAGNDEGRFEINDNGMISIAVKLDFETTRNHTLAIVASDGEQTDEASLVVNVLDENEFSPELSGPTDFSLDEELAAGTLVGTISATDGDGSAPNNEITYAFSTQTNLEDHFILDSSSGRITTAAVLNREMLTDIFPAPASSITVQVFARDGGSPSLQNNRMYTITLRDINDNAPEFGNEEYSNSIFENQPAQVVLSFSATDVDLGSNAEIRFSFTVDPIEGAPLFRLADDSVGEISTTQGLDCEVQESYDFTITATDQGNPSQSTSVPATLSLRDQNDNRPIFTENPYIFTVSENALLDTVVGEVLANDVDKGTNGEVFYEILGQDDLEEESESAGGGITFFEINEDNGEIVHITGFDFESFPQINITVRASDRGTPRLSSTTQVVFNVTNVDEVAPFFPSSCNDVGVSENIPVDSEVINCMATDVDNTTTVDDPDWITYTIDSGNTDNTFVIGMNNGIIRNAIKLDYETNNFFRLEIRATDGSGRSRTRFLKIDVEDENDNAPNFQSSSYSFAMTSELIEANTQMVARVSASDNDSGRNGDLYYTIDQNGVRQMNLTETRITITARDRGDTPQSSNVVLTVRFEEGCLLQRYTIDADSGVVMADVLCSVQIRSESTDVVLGGDHTVYCSVVRNVPTTYQWLLNGSTIDLTASLPNDDQEVALNIDNVDFQDGGEYACKVTTAAGSLQTSTYTVNVLGKFTWCALLWSPWLLFCIYKYMYIVYNHLNLLVVVPVITIAPTPTAVMENESVEFNCFAVGKPLPEVYWEYKDRVVERGNTLIIGII